MRNITPDRRIASLERWAQVGAYAPRPRAFLEDLEVCELKALEALAEENDALARVDHPLVAAMLRAAQARAARHVVPPLVAERQLRGCRAAPPTGPLPPR